MPDSLQRIPNTPVWNTEYSNRLDSQGKTCCKPSTDMMVHSRHTGTSNSRTPIMCQTWHRGAQLCIQPPEEKSGAAEEAHPRRQKSQPRFSTPQLTTPQHKRRPHQGISRQIQRNWPVPRDVSHHLTQ